MERIFDQTSLIKTIKDGIKKGYWTLKDIDRPSQGWTEVINDCKGNSLFPKGYKGVKHRNLARTQQVEERVEVIDPKDYPTI